MNYVRKPKCLKSTGMEDHGNKQSHTAEIQTKNNTGKMPNANEMHINIIQYSIYHVIIFYFISDVFGILHYQKNNALISLVINMLTLYHLIRSILLTHILFSLFNFHTFYLYLKTFLSLSEILCCRPSHFPP